MRKSTYCGADTLIGFRIVTPRNGDDGGDNDDKKIGRTQPFLLSNHHRPHARQHITDTAFNCARSVPSAHRYSYFGPNHRGKVKEESD